VSRYHYLTCCVSSVAHHIDAMVDRAREVTYGHARRLIDPEAWWQFMANQGYEIQRGRHGLTMRNDYAVRYFTSIYRGRRCCYIVHSAIEYIFT
jgi:hypothetical protein